MNTSTGKIGRFISSRFGVSWKAVRSPSKLARVTVARSVVAAYYYHRLKMTFQEVAFRLGRTTPSGARWLVNNYSNLYATDSRFRNKIHKLNIL